MTLPQSTLLVDGGADPPARRLRRLWHQGDRPDVRDFVAAAGDLSPSHLAAVLRVDQRERWMLGERVAAEAYLRDFPILAMDREATFDLVYGEYLLREELGEAAPLAEYHRRFPELADSLQRQAGAPQFPDAVAGPMQETTTDPATPTGRARAAGPTLPGYEIIGELGKGAMGVVYKARQTALKRLVALKMIRGDDAGEEELARFRTEAEAVARLQHPNVVQVYGVGEHDGLPFFSMEYVDGGSLARKLSGAPWPARQAAVLVETLAGAVQAAHDGGVVHRDLKPGNVLLPAGKFIPKVADFGLAKRLDADTAQTRTGVVMGTPSYMAPEQASGRVHEVGPLVGVYALGAILYELLTGRPPFRAASVLETLEQVRTQEPVPVRALQPRCPRDLETICLKCLRKEPGKRYGSARELGDDLRRFLGGLPVRARPVRLWERAAKWARRNPLLAATVMVAGLVTVALVGVIVWSNFSLADAAKKAETEASNARIAGANEKAERLKKQDQVVRQYVAHVTRAIADDDLATALPWAVAALRADRHDPDDPETAARQFIHRIRISAILHQFPRSVHVWPPEELGFDATFSPDGRLLVHVRGKELRVWDVATREPHGPAWVLPNPIGHVAFSPDGRRIAASHRHKSEFVVSVAEVGTWQPLGPLLRQAVDPPQSKLMPEGLTWWTHSPQLAFSPDGTLLLAHELGTARVWDLATSEPVGPLRTNSDPAEPAITLDNRRLILVRGNDVHVEDPRTGKAVYTPLRHPDKVEQALVTPDGRYIVSRTMREVRIWDTVTGKIHTELHRAFFWGTRWIALSPNGRSLLTTSETPYRSDQARTEIRFWDVNTGRPVGAPTWCPGQAKDVRFLADGAHYLVLNERGEAQIWDTVSRQPVTTPLRPSRVSFVDEVTLSPDGRFLLQRERYGSSRLWDLAAGRPTARPLPAFLTVSEVITARFSQDGSRLLLALGSVRREAREMQLWDTATGRLACPPLKLDGRLNEVLLAGDGRRVAFLHTTPEEIRQCQLWELVGGSPPSRVGSPISPVYKAAFSPDGRQLVTLDPQSAVRLWDAATGRALAGSFSVPRGGSVMAVSNSGALALANGPEIRFWDTATGQSVGEPLRTEAPSVKFLAFGPDGRQLLTRLESPENSMVGSARVWNLETRSPVTPLLHERLLNIPPAFSSPDAGLLLLADPLQGFTLFDARTGQPVSPRLELALGAWSIDSGCFIQGVLTAACRSVQGQLMLAKWDLTPDPRSEAELEAHAAALTGLRVDAVGALVPLAPQERYASWTELKTRHPDRLVASDEDLIAWHRAVGLAHAGNDHWTQAVHHFDRILETHPDEVWVHVDRAGAHASLRQWNKAIADCTRAVDLGLNSHRGRLVRAESHFGRGEAYRYAKKWDEARADYDRAIAFAPKDPKPLRHRGHLHMRLGRTAEAVADFTGCTGLAPNDPTEWHFLALAHLASGDADGYRRVCATVAERFRNEKRPDACFGLVRTCALVADAGVEPLRLLAWAETTEKAWPTDADSLTAAGMALYRADRYDEALSRLREAEKAAKGGAGIDRAFFMALALHRSGQVDPAREWLARAIGSHDKLRKEDPDVPNSRLWSQQFQLGALRAEAEATLKTPPGPPRP